MTIEVIGNRIVEVVEPDEVQSYITEEDADMDARAVAAVRAAIEKAKVCKKPIARYDNTSKRAYIEYPDGRIEYVK